MTSTDDLIRSLASAAGAGRSASLRFAFAVTGAASLACALLLVFSVIGIRHDFADMPVRMPFAFKLAYTGSLVVGTSVVALYAATPAHRQPRYTLYLQQSFCWLSDSYSIQRLFRSWEEPTLPLRSA